MKAKCNTTMFYSKKSQMYEAGQEYDLNKETIKDMTEIGCISRFDLEKPEKATGRKGIAYAVEHVQPVGDYRSTGIGTFRQHHDSQS